MEHADQGEPQRLTQRLREYHQVLGSFARMASEPIAREQLLHHAAAQVARVTHIKRAKVMRYRPDKGDLLVEAGVGWKPRVVGHATLGMDHRSPPGRSVQTAGPVAVEDFPNDGEFDHSGLFADYLRTLCTMLEPKQNLPVETGSRTRLCFPVPF
jgi:hypothetical protein